MRPLKLFRSLSVDTSRSDNEWKEAADRFMDTSWQIHKQWFTETNASAFPTAEIQPAENQTNVKPNETTLTKTKRTNSVPNGIIRYSDDDARERKSGTPGRKVVQIETVQTTCESVGPPEKIKTDVILIFQKVPLKNNPQKIHRRSPLGHIYLPLSFMP
ncbi:uncharacterized protein LOC116172310 [Photinus pyralis]|uniref:uncharacterized protein LOC116172310 n=1 Tax=Photinus pyralis TaxID=7054 RepID=UPI0012676E45|nr:uncharacterized protein LOC116172310 [Photinus pyralis]